MSADWKPRPATRTDARTATIVFPLPTSPCRRRAIGCPDLRSAPISRIGLLLRGGQREGQDRRERATESRIRLDPRRGTHRSLPTPPCESHLELEELLEREPPEVRGGPLGPRARIRRATRAAGKVRLPERLDERREPQQPDHLCRKPLRKAGGGLVERPGDEPSVHSRREAREGTVDRDDAPDGEGGIGLVLRLRLDVGRFEREAPLHHGPTVDEDPEPDGQPARQPRLVVEDEADLPALVLESRFGDRETATPCPDEPDLDHLSATV